MNFIELQACDETSIWIKRKKILVIELNKEDNNLLIIHFRNSCVNIKNTVHNLQKLLGDNYDQR